MRNSARYIEIAGTFLRVSLTLVAIGLYSQPMLAGNICIEGVVTNDVDPNQVGTGLDGLWSYSGDFGLTAGDAMCQEIGADHVCSYEELLAADDVGELDPMLFGSYWVNRVSLTVQLGDFISPPGPGGRCNDWTVNTNHATDGEYLEDTQFGPEFFLDPDTFYDGNPGSGHQQAGLDCHVPRAIPCCKKKCVLLFADGFEGGNTDLWSSVSP